MKNVIQLFTRGEVQTQDKIFTRLVGGFGEDNAVISDLQVANLLDYKMGARFVRQHVERNSKHFEEGLHYLDISKRVAESNTLKETLISLGYSKQSLTQAKNIYLFSEAGLLLYLKFSEGDESVKVYKDFLEDYFKVKAENREMKETIKLTLEQLKEEKATLLGKSIMAVNDSDRLEFMQMVEKKNLQIIELEKSISEQELIKKLESKLHMSELIENSKSNYDIGKFAKVLNISGLGRNKLFDWMREEKLLMKDNSPYQQHMKYFTVIPVVNNGYTTYKTLLKPQGVDYVMKKLIKSGKIIAKSVDEVLSELEAV